MISELIARQRAYFETGATKPYAFRKAALLRLRDALRRHDTDISEALRKDLNKTSVESYLTETGIVLADLSHALRNLKRWMKPQRRASAVSQLPGSAAEYPDPFGVVLIAAPWNYPLQLTLAPLVGALAAGNCAVLKPSKEVPAIGHVMAVLIAEAFPPEYVTVVEGTHPEAHALLQEHFDYIFFTGSQNIGRMVMENAAKHLTPITLELGGKSPVIVEASADLRLTARRIAFGKLINAGQTCVAPDYVLVEEKVHSALVEELKKAFAEQLPEADLSSFPRIINDKHFARLTGLLSGSPVVYGGKKYPESRQISPTVLDPVSPEEPVMQEEIFGPLLPVLPVPSLAAAMTFVASRPHPLALYLFTRDKAVERQVLGTLAFGGGCVNDTVLHVASSHTAFGGVGESGMGRYHGKASFDTFTHYKTVLRQSSRIDMRFRYRPYGKGTEQFVRGFWK